MVGKVQLNKFDGGDITKPTLTTDAVTFVPGAIDTATDMTAAQAAQILADLGNLKARIDAANAVLQAHGLAD